MRGMKFHLKKGESAGKGISRINRALCERVQHLLAGGDALTDSTVFELRKTVKKLRAVLRITRPALARDTYRELDRLLRDFGRDLGRTRDSAVLLDTLDSLLEHFSPLPDEIALQPVRNALHCRYQLAMEDFLQASDEHPLAARFGAIERRIGKLDLRRFSDDLLLKGIRRTYRRSRKLLRKLHAEPSTLNSHDLRRQVKYAWNQLRLLRKRDPHRYQPLIADLDRLGGLLGRDSDLALLVETLRRHRAIGCGHVRTEFIVALAESRRIAVLTTAIGLADRCLARKPGEFSAWLKPATPDPAPAATKKGP
jgi:CHAD domain-containing protein